MRIYIGFAKLEKEFFGHSPYIRLSALYKDPAVMDQIAIDYLPRQHHLATPAFYSVVKYKNGHLDFIKKHLALEKGYELVYHEGYPFFQETS